jgi:hypothetical protein
MLGWNVKNVMRCASLALAVAASVQSATAAEIILNCTVSGSEDIANVGGLWKFDTDSSTGTKWDKNDGFFEYIICRNASSGNELNQCTISPLSIAGYTRNFGGTVWEFSIDRRTGTFSSRRQYLGRAAETGTGTCEAAKEPAKPQTKF